MEKKMKTSDDFTRELEDDDSVIKDVTLIGSSDDFTRELEDDDSVIKDVTLIGSDSGRVPAAKAVLAIRSPVFRKMFYGGFRETSGDCESVKLNYPAPVLRAVVSYCYTSRTDFKWYFEDKGCNHDKDGNPPHHSDSSAVAFVQLLDAANYLELPALRESIFDLFKYMTTSYCAVLQELMIRGDTDGELWTTILVRTMLVQIFNPAMFFFPWELGYTNAGIRGISFPLLKIIFQFLENLGTDYTYVVIKALKTWNETHHSVAEEERSMLRNWAEKLNFESIDISCLAKIKPCPLFPAERLYLVFLGAYTHEKERNRGKRRSCKQYVVNT